MVQGEKFNSFTIKKKHHIGNMKQEFHFAPIFGFSYSAHKEQDEVVLYTVQNSIYVTLITVAKINTY
jgi:hypothetical protein